MNKKVIVSDYDKTFYLNDEDIEKNKTAVSKFEKEGNIFIIATGRSFSDFKRAVDNYKLDYKYAILNHGATIIDDKDNLIYNVCIDKNIISKVKEDVNIKNAIRILLFNELDDVTNFENTNLTKINIKYGTQDEATEINKKLNNKYSEYINSYNLLSKSIEIISNKTNKSKAINLLIEKLNINNKNVYTIGDGFSDIQMVKDFNGYCMNESVEELKKIATKQYSSVSELINEVMEK